MENYLDANVHSDTTAKVVGFTISSMYRVILVIDRGRRDPFNKVHEIITSRYHITDKSDYNLLTEKQDR